MSAAIPGDVLPFSVGLILGWSEDRDGGGNGTAVMLVHIGHPDHDLAGTRSRIGLRHDHAAAVTDVELSAVRSGPPSQLKSECGDQPGRGRLDALVSQDGNRRAEGHRAIVGQEPGTT